MRRRGRGTAGARGQSLAEFALVLPILLLIVLFAIDAGRLFLGWVEINNAARIAANYASLHPDADWTDPSDPDRLRFEALIQQEATVLNCVLESPLPQPTFPSGTALGSPAEAAFSCSFDVLTPVIGGIIGDPLTISVSSSFPIRNGSILGTPLGSSLPTASSTATPAPTETPAPSGPTPDPSAPTPAPTATPCTRVVPDLVTGTITYTQGASTWTSTGFTTTLVKLTPPSNNYDIGWQSLVAGQSQPCDATMQVARNAP